MNSKNTSDGNEVARRMSIFGRMGKKGEEANSK